VYFIHSFQLQKHWCAWINNSSHLVTVTLYPYRRRNQAALFNRAHPCWQNTLIVQSHFLWMVWWNSSKINTIEEMKCTLCPYLKKFFFYNQFKYTNRTSQVVELDGSYLYGSIWSRTATKVMLLTKVHILSTLAKQLGITNIWHKV